MKKIYLVKKDPLMPTSEDNWIYMNQHEFIAFMNTPAGKSRKDNFGQLDGVDEDDVIYIVESEPKLATQMRKEKKRHDYLHQIEIDENICLVSLDNPTYESSEDELSLQEKYFIADDDVVRDTIKHLDCETLRFAISTLDEEERMILQSLYLDEKPVSARKLSLILNVPVMTLHKRKNRILKKIRNYF